MMGPYVAAKNLVRKRITLTPVTGGRKSNEVGIAAFDQPPAVCFGPCPADTGPSRHRKSSPKRPRMAGLAIVDSGKYAESSDAAAQSFKPAVPKDQWQSMLGQTCGPLG